MFSLVSRVCWCAVAAAIGCAFGQEPVLPPGMPLVIRDFDRIATEAVRNPSETGYTLGVATREGLAWTKSYGAHANAESSYGIGCGAFTAIMLLQMTRAGSVHLSDPVAKYVPELKAARNPYPDAAPVTLLQLALHTSGLALDAAEGAPYLKGTAAEWAQTLLAALPHTMYEFEPGTHAAASNIEDALLALALSRAARQPYNDYVQQRILAPLGMTHTRFPAAGSADPNLGYRTVMYTTVGDLARLASFAMLGGSDTVLPRNSVEENYRRLYITNSIAIPNPNEGYGIGFHGETWTSNHYYFILPVGYDGPGYDAALWFEPRRHAGVILLHQGGNSPALGQMIHSYVYTLNAQKNDAGRQELLTPRPYSEEEVSFDNRAAEIKLAGTLTMPRGQGPFPAVVLIPKAGPFDRDEQMLNHRPFLVLADALTRAGVAVLRTDARGVGKTGGKLSGAPLEDSASDAEAAMAYLKTRPELDARKIGLVGHGEGGISAAIAAARNRDVAFVVTMGASAVSGAQNIVESGRLNAEANGELYAKAEAQGADRRKIFDLVMENQDAAVLESKLRELLAGKAPDAQIAAQIRQFTSPAFRRTLSYDPSAEFRKLACPVLALYAEKDLSVPVELNLPAMRAALEASGTKNFQVEKLADLNMLFQTADVGIGREANWTEETIAPIALKTITDWIAQR